MRPWRSMLRELRWESEACEGHRSHSQTDRGDSEARCGVNHFTQTECRTLLQPSPTRGREPEAHSVRRDREPEAHSVRRDEAGVCLQIGFDPLRAVASSRAGDVRRGLAVAPAGFRGWVASRRPRNRLRMALRRPVEARRGLRPLVRRQLGARFWLVGLRKSGTGGQARRRSSFRQLGLPGGTQPSPVASASSTSGSPGCRPAGRAAGIPRAGGRRAGGSNSWGGSRRRPRPWSAARAWGSARAPSSTWGRGRGKSPCAATGS